MGSKERKARNRLNMHHDILQAAWKIVREEGHGALSLRRLANDIDYSATTVYLYFKDKEELELDLARVAYQKLNVELQASCKHSVDPRERLKAMVMSYWQYATSERQLYLLIQAVEMRTEDLKVQVAEADFFANRIEQAIDEIVQDQQTNEGFSTPSRYAFMATVKGFISVHLTHPELDMPMKTALLTDAISNLLKF